MREYGGRDSICISFYQLSSTTRRFSPAKPSSSDMTMVPVIAKHSLKTYSYICNLSTWAIGFHLQQSIVDVCLTAPIHQCHSHVCPFKASQHEPDPGRSPEGGQCFDGVRINQAIRINKPKFKILFGLVIHMGGLLRRTCWATRLCC